MADLAASRWSGCDTTRTTMRPHPNAGYRCAGWTRRSSSRGRRGISFPGPSHPGSTHIRTSAYCPSRIWHPTMLPRHGRHAHLAGGRRLLPRLSDGRDHGRIPETIKLFFFCFYVAAWKTGPFQSTVSSSKCGRSPKDAGIEPAPRRDGPGGILALDFFTADRCVPGSRSLVRGLLHFATGRHRGPRPGRSTTAAARWHHRPGSFPGPAARPRRWRHPRISPGGIGIGTHKPAPPYRPAGGSVSRWPTVRSGRPSGRRPPATRSPLAHPVGMSRRPARPHPPWNWAAAAADTGAAAPPPLRRRGPGERAHPSSCPSVTDEGSPADPPPGW